MPDRDYDDSVTNYIALAVPLFFLAIGAELVLARRRARKVYRFSDAISDLSCGMTSQVFVLFFAAAQLALYTWLYEHHRLVTLPLAASWLLAFVGLDFLYYWWHRASHEVNALWALHIVHHQSEDYNFAVALRQSILTSWTALAFYSPLALLGVPPVVYASTLAFSTLYQFWIHTQLVRKFSGPLDWVFNLPSHHRVHHAINPEYLDKNYGATLIVWDRLFGTYEEEIAPPVYGITKPLGSFNAAWANVHYFVEMAKMAHAAPRFLDKLRVGWKSPAWAPEGLPKPLLNQVSPDTYQKFDPVASTSTQTYVAIQFVIVVAATFTLMMWQSKIPPIVVLTLSAMIVLALVSFAALLEGRRSGKPFEIGRLVILAGACVWLSLR